MHGSGRFRCSTCSRQAFWLINGAWKSNMVGTMPRACLGWRRSQVMGRCGTCWTRSAPITSVRHSGRFASDCRQATSSISIRVLAGRCCAHWMGSRPSPHRISTAPTAQCMCTKGKVTTQTWCWRPYWSRLAKSTSLLSTRNSSGRSMDTTSRTVNSRPSNVGRSVMGSCLQTDLSSISASSIRLRNSWATLKDSGAILPVYVSQRVSRDQFDGRNHPAHPQSQDCLTVILRLPFGLDTSRPLPCSCPSLSSDP